MLQIFRKKLNISSEELDTFLNNKNVSTKYYLEKKYLKNKVFLYLILLRLKGVNLNSFFDQTIQTTFKEYKKFIKK